MAPRWTPSPAQVAERPPAAGAASSSTATWTPTATLPMGQLLEVPTAAAAEVSSVTPTIKVSAPIAVRARHPFTATGSIKNSSAEETVTVRLERQTGSAWIADEIATTTLLPNRTFSLALTPPHQGQLRVVATIPSDSDHVAGAGQTLVHCVGTKVIALTFDDGPWPSSTQAIVRILNNNGIHATFFEIGSQVKPRASLSKLVIANGNIIGVHTWNHALLTRRSAAVNKADLRTTKGAIWKATGFVPTWFRPPYGATNKSIASIARGLGLRQVLWTVDTLDWKIRKTPSIVSRAVRGARSGGIILMHDGGGPRKATVNAVPIIIAKLRAQGYDFVTLDEMATLGYKIR